MGVEVENQDQGEVGKEHRGVPSSESEIIPELKAYLRHVLQCSGTPDDCDTCAEASTLAFLIPTEPSPEKLKELRELFIRPVHECTEQFQEAKLLAGTVDALAWCFKCREHAVVNNVCLECGNDERAKYGDFDHEMTTEEWEDVMVNLPLPAPRPRDVLAGTAEQQQYWTQKQKESRARAALAKVNAPAK